MLGAPIDWVQQYLNRPTSMISRSEYIRRAQLIAKRAKEVVVSHGGRAEGSS